MFINILLVSLGGAIGAALRFTITPQIDKLFISNFPYGIFIVNIIGCFFIGLIASLFENKLMLSENLKIFLIVGFLGSLTTFSTFALDNFNFINQKNFYLLFLNLFLTNFLGLFMVLLGIRTIKIFN
ncbi:MAG: fluoride efflux transporter CrcB [Chloroflexi bacterium]|jgi:CrcB protein|nr:fluoride efflux transporter CrcB [Chloroflexota bacterium]MBP05902.1 fluoride efflux transporter CrcB [Chloroflexota bacterium]RZP14428.1 MAG: fluoride efflux transporter CrcB [Chloroflexota bacterium]|tara:strand:- start:19545 stop:19925 length:381 start_codon:yes stop_codon:yes gene_type:complete